MLNSILNGVSKALNAIPSISISAVPPATIEAEYGVKRCAVKHTGEAYKPEPASA